MEFNSNISVKDEQHLLEKAIASEVLAFQNYSNLTKIVVDPKSKERLLHLANDEESHVLALTSKYRKLFDQNPQTPSPKRPESILSRKLKEHISLDAKKIIKLAISEEEEAIKMYNFAAQQTGIEELEKLFLSLVGAEKSHIVVLNDEKNRIEQGVAEWI
ncbi:MAG: ferritin family protein [Deltaproteobacteria bacterium]|jgi:rubrerythrin|nr:ferritin family protein [Deltaproteobacteria bacterium]